MGFKISWIGFHGLTKAAVLEMVGGADTGVADEANEAPFSGAEIPGTWYILFSNDFGFVSRMLLKSLSANGTVVGCQVHEGIMVSTAYAYERGIEQWSLTHNSENGIRDLCVSGSPPPAFEKIHDRLSKEQDANGGESASVDYFFRHTCRNCRNNVRLQA
ncbi:MAG TPA: hypothetical protein VHZ24_00600 [Pirellulales bacterium]|nr:hypothetical protein [Pirellulales bacterium]